MFMHLSFPLTLGFSCEYVMLQLPLTQCFWCSIHLLIDVIQHWLRLQEMKVLLYHRLFEKWPISDKPPSIIFLVSSSTYWKVKWLCEHPVISHWKCLTHGPNTHLWSFSVACLLTLFSVCSSSQNLPQGRHVAMANTASNDTFSLVPGHSPW